MREEKTGCGNSRESHELGDLIEQLTESTGVAKLVRRYLGEDCGCEERKERLNEVSRWARKALKNKSSELCELLKLLS